MNRREALKNVGLLLGGTIITSQTFLTGCVFEKDKVLDEDNSIFDKQSISLMNEIGEIIIPTTDTPGAKDAEVGRFMAVMIRDCYQEDLQDVFITGLVKIDQNFNEQYGTSFVDGNPKDKLQFVSKMEQETEDYYQIKKPEDPPHYYSILKELTLLGYFTSEIGCTQALNYIHTPGSYQACIPFEKGGRAWAAS